MRMAATEGPAATMRAGPALPQAPSLSCCFFPRSANPAVSPREKNQCIKPTVSGVYPQSLNFLKRKSEYIYFSQMHTRQ